MFGTVGSNPASFLTLTTESDMSDEVKIVKIISLSGLGFFVCYMLCLSSLTFKKLECVEKATTTEIALICRKR